MEIRRLSLCLAFLLVAVISHCSGKEVVFEENRQDFISLMGYSKEEARHSMARRGASDDFFTKDTEQQDDPGSDTEQNDEGDDEEGIAPNATILTNPEVYKVPIGVGVHLECRLNVSNNDVIVNWKKGDTEIGIVINGMVVGDQSKYQKDGTDLIIHDATVDDAGSYKCEVVQSAPAKLVHEVVILRPAKIVDVSVTGGGNVEPGSELTLSCTADGNPVPKVVWSREFNGSNQRLAESSIYTIPNVKPEDSGKYFCYAFGNKTADTRIVLVSVKRRPQVHVHRNVINSAIGVEAFMQCNVHEKEPVTIRWFKGNQEISPSLYSTQGTQSNFTVTPMSDADFGTYSCMAEVDFGTHQRSIELVERPIVERLEADGQKLSWSVHSHQPLKNIEIQLIDTTNGTLTKLNIPVPEHKTHQYDISYEVNSDVKPGNYEVLVKVENTKGISEENESIMFEQEPARIQVAGLGASPGSAHTQHPTTALISTVLMYLLVRML